MPINPFSSPWLPTPSNTRSRGTKIQANIPESKLNCSLVLVLTQIVQMSTFLFGQDKINSNSLWQRWWGSRLPHTWRNHSARSPHSCRPFDQVIHFFISPCILGLCFLRRNTIGILDTSARWFLKHPIIFSQPLYNRPSLVSLRNEYRRNDYICSLSDYQLP